MFLRVQRSVIVIDVFSNVKLFHHLSREYSLQILNADLVLSVFVIALSLSIHLSSEKHFHFVRR
jgi:hypothetical protein